MKMRREGFTLIEILLFGVIFTVVSIAFLSILVTVTNVETSQTSATDVSQQGQFLMQAFQRYVEQSSAIESPTSTSESLVLRMPSHLADPTVITLFDGTVWIQESSSAVQTLTSPRIKVTDLNFTRRSITGAHDTVDVSLTLRYNTLNPRQFSTQTLNTSIARVGAASFDSDIVPAGAAPVKLGIQTDDIQSINNTLFLGGGSVGIGSYLFTPEARLHINGGGMKFTNSPSRPSCDSSRRGLFWAALSTSTGISDALLGCVRTSQGSYVWRQYAEGSGGAPPAPAPTVLSIIPASATSGIVANIGAVSGSDFVSGATVKTMKTGSPDITGSGFSVLSSSTIGGGTLDLTAAASGTWNVVVTNPDLQFGILADGFTVTASASVPWYNAAWPYRQKITIDYAKVSSTLANFPVYVNLANMQAGFFSNVSSTGADMRITKADAMTEVPREVVAINTGASTGELWFKAPTLSASTNTDFYIYYGNAAATEPAATSTYGKNNVWDINYKGAWHLGETSGSFADSTSGGSNGTLTDANSNSVRGATGKLGSALDLNGDADFVSAGVPSWYGTSWTWTAWANLDVSSANMILSHGTGWGGNGAYMSVYNGPLYVTVNQSQAVDAASFPTTSWQYVVAVNNNGSLSLYRNGNRVGGPTTIVNPSSPTNNFEMGRFNSGIQYWNGKIDEVQISNTARSSQWILTEYNNQSSPSAFYAVGSQETSP